MEPYQLTKTIRFKLEPENSVLNTIIEEKTSNVEGVTALETADDSKRLQGYIENLGNTLEQLLTENTEFVEAFRASIFVETEKNKLRFQEKSPEIKYGFLKLYKKNSYYELIETNKRRTYELTNLLRINEEGKSYNFLEQEFERWFDEWSLLMDLLQKTVDKLHHEQHNFDRRSEIGMLIRRLNGRMLYPFVRDFILMTDSKTDHLEYRVKQLGDLLEKCESTLRPAQADGMIIGRASFNYYTVHKVSKYQDNDISGTEKFDNDINRISGERYLQDNAEEANVYRIIFTHFFDYNIKIALNITNATELFSKINGQIGNVQGLFEKLVKTITNKKGVIDNELVQKKTDLKLAKSPSKKGQLEKRIKYLKSIKTSYSDDIRVLSETKIISDSLAKLDSDVMQENLVLLNSLYQGMKEFKASEKQKFYQAVQAGNVDIKDLDNYPLFSEIYLPKKHSRNQKKEFVQFLNLSKDIEKLSAKLNQGNLSRESRERGLDRKREKCKSRGKYLTTLEGNKLYFEGYVKFCELFKSVALKRGRIKAKVKALEAEKADSQRVQYWAITAEKQDDMYLLLFPKMLDTKSNGKAYSQKAYKALSTMQDAQKGDIKLHLFESMTHRALEKLCFSGVQEGTNTFWRPVEKEIGSNANNWFKDSVRHDPYNFINESEKIRFYQSVLNTDYAKKVLKGIDFDLMQDAVIDTDFGDDFLVWRQALEGLSYVKHIKISGKGFGKLAKQYNAQIFRICSKDLTRDARSKSAYKAHTVLWKKFWTEENENNQFKIRLNPEISISWREAKASRLYKYAKGGRQYDVKRFDQNRYLQPQYTLRTTITENATGKTIGTRFVEAPTVRTKLEIFNRELLEQDKNNPIQHVIGIDVGKTDLAAMTLFKKKDDFMVSNGGRRINIGMLEPMEGAVEYFDAWEVVRNPGTGQFDFKKNYQFKTTDETRDRYVINNPSYFASKSSYEYAFPEGDYERDFTTFFRKKSVPGLDLTIAKVIDGKILVNGDLKTYLKLKERNARRQLCIIKELHSDAELAISDKKKGGKALYFRSLNCTDQGCVCQFVVYHYNRKYDIPDFERAPNSKETADIQVLKQIKEKLQRYLDKNQPSLLIEESKINHLRKALTANMVGVLHHIYHKYNCLIALEDIDHNTIESHRQQFSGNITRFLEWAVYRKFQNTYRVPPDLKDILNLRGSEKKGLYQFGMVFWVDKEGTSKVCPACGKSSSKNYEVNKCKGLFDCEHCVFNTDPEAGNQLHLVGIDDPDKVAAFNIAKIGYATYVRAIKNNGAQE